MVTCSSCGKEIPSTWTVCPYCVGSWERVSPERLGVPRAIIWGRGMRAPDWLLVTINVFMTTVNPDPTTQARFALGLASGLRGRGLIKKEDEQFLADYVVELMQTKGYLAYL